MEETLREACCLGNLTLVKKLVQNGVNINSTNKVNGWTALHWAAKRSHIGIVNYLLNMGAAKNIKNLENQLASDLASNKVIRVLLGDEGSCDLGKSDQLPFVPNYLLHPPLVLDCFNEYSAANIELPVRKENLDDPTFIKSSKFLLLKTRIAGNCDPDFIEIEISRAELTFNSLKEICCKELQISIDNFSKLRKLPNIIVRNDNDVNRLKEFDEIEVILQN